MSRLIAVLLISFLAIPARAQVETLLGEDVSYGGFGAAALKLSAINGEPAFFRGFRGGWIINMDEHTVTLGAGYYSLQNSIPADIESSGIQPLPPLDVHYGGFETEYLYRTNKLIHLFVPTLIGSGSVTYEFAESSEAPRTITEDFFVLEPALGAELNVLRWFRVGAAIAYRWIDGIDIEGTSERRLSNLTGSITFKIGWF